jgi:hypothetical protein
MRMAAAGEQDTVEMSFDPVRSCRRRACGRATMPQMTHGVLRSMVQHSDLLGVTIEREASCRRPHLLACHAGDALTALNAALRRG